MKLENFFTPIEMKVGLASVSRVEQFVTFMQQYKFHIANNIAEAIHHCSTVSTVLSATQNMDCLRQFVLLGGLHYMNKWFHEVLKNNDKSADEVITAVLEALEKLPMDQEGLESCGIGNSLGYLLSHENLEIQGRARSLSEGWEKIISSNLESQEKGNGGLCHDGNNSLMVEAILDEEYSNCEKASLHGEDPPKKEASGSKLEEPSLAGMPCEAVKEGKMQLSSQGNSETSSGGNETLVSESNSPEDITGEKSTEEMIREKAEVDVAYEEEDALEVARQVAKEVEEAVGIYREASCSSSMKEMNSETQEVTTADSTEVKKTQSLIEIRDKGESCPEHDIPDSFCSAKEGVGSQISVGSEHRKDEILHEQESSQITTLPQEPADSERTHPCTFDLNEDVETEETECHEQSITVTVSPAFPAPIPVLATSRGPVGLPVTPLHFRGELGWKGSAATSAFRPASTRRTPDQDRACSTEENKCNSKNSLSFRGIDLNVADVGNDAAVDMFMVKHVPVSSSLPSGDSSVEVSSNRVERLNFDLNRLGDNDDNCQDLLSDHRHRNGACSPSASSSSRPSMRDFDLNDNPSSFEAQDLLRPGQELRPLRSGRLDDHVVSILGSGIQLEPNIQADLGSVQGFGRNHGRKEFLNQPQSFLLPTPGVVPSIGPMGRMVYATPSAFPYNGLGLGTIPLPSSVYVSGAVPYMVDSRGIPQILGSSSTLSPFPRAPYLMGVTGGPNTNDFGISRPNIDLNAGLTSMDAADTRERGNIRHMFFPTNNSLAEEQMKSFQQVSMTGSSLKRKEPDCGRDPYQVGYKQVTSWH